MPITFRAWGGRSWPAAVMALVVTSSLALADKPETKTSLRAGPITAEEWKKVSNTPLAAGEIDALIAKEQQEAGVKPAPLTTDEQFIRRVYLDVVGRIPSAEEVLAFVADKDAKKRAKLIDKLLESDDYAANWSTYWRDVLSARITGGQGRILARPFETWIRTQLKENKRWHEITKDMLTATGQVKFDEGVKAGAHFFLGAHMGQDATVEQAAETSRVFLGIQINCAQCHDHPFDVWKREQFHELAAYFVRTRPRLVREEQRFVGIEIGGNGRGFGGGFGGRGGDEYRMPAKDGTQNRFGGGTVVNPKFIDGSTPGRGLSDKDRRDKLVSSIVSKDNPWYAAAFVNRTWGLLLGQSFYTPVDDLGPQKEAVFGSVLVRVAAHFRSTDHDIKDLFRVILNSETYQRQSVAGQSAGDHLQFAASYPARLRPNALWSSMTQVLGRMDGGFGGLPGRRPGGGGFGGFGGFGGVEGAVKSEFAFDPSLKPEDIEGSIPQALILMNNPAVQAKVSAKGDTMLARTLTKHEKDEEALHQVYLRVLCRKPTERETAKCLAHIKGAASRGDGFEDVLWALLNSTEFQTRR